MTIFDRIRSGLLLAAFVLILAPHGAAHAAKGWGLDGEQEASFDATVVDVLCELTGDCPPNCGEGDRQLGVVREDGTLLLVVKGATLFANAVKDLLPYCGQSLTVDGLVIENEYMQMFFPQFIRPPGGMFTKTNRFSKDFKASYPDKKGPWWKGHPQVLEKLERTGILGIPGLEPEPEE